jgi:signal transduction histidine kinase
LSRFQIEAEKILNLLKINITLSEIDNLISTDEESIHILSHLFSNAIKFTNYGVIEIGCLKEQRYHFYVEDLE